jgi:hypothetical protein
MHFTKCLHFAHEIKWFVQLSSNFADYCRFLHINYSVLLLWIWYRIIWILNNTRNTMSVFNTRKTTSRYCFSWKYSNVKCPVWTELMSWSFDYFLVQCKCPFYASEKRCTNFHYHVVSVWPIKCLIFCLSLQTLSKHVQFISRGNLKSACHRTHKNY